MKRLTGLLKNIGFMHIAIQGKTRSKEHVIDSVLDRQKGIYIIVTDRIITQYEWENFSSRAFDNSVMSWNGFGLAMTDHILYVGASSKHLKGEIDRHTRGSSYENRGLKLADYKCPEFNYMIHAFFPDPNQGYCGIDLDNLEDLVKKYLKPVVGRI
ncbi:hypothetical protein B9T10_04120 [Wohlfahrtiimonas chitiniclastica]|uniref:hypothetical protein n=1 Tax=Wohlfahrtiimonas chitiniclastica TaxID=400946 RepID=UPI000B9894EB|nr:hypothetical protein [Wohlfahrtiimonas chitiniclastica]OYQ90515.1 hypothetical protein B9T10_04120 [Wohlfahrtiimonas chitiniclastica]